jgi:hypothetical protein
MSEWAIAKWSCVILANVYALHGVWLGVAAYSALGIVCLVCASVWRAAEPIGLEKSDDQGSADD